MRMIVGHCDDPDAGYAVQQVIRQVEEGLDGGTPRGALLYCCIDIDHQAILDAIAARWPGLPLIGCTTDGECSSTLQFMEDSVVLTVFEGDELDLRVGLGTGVRDDPDRAAADAIAQLGDLGGSALVVTVPESIGVSGAEVVRALDARLPDDVILVGGTAGDQWQFVQTRQFFGDRVLTGSVPLLAIGGPLKISVGVASGRQPLGRTGTVTRAEGARVLEIDGKPAIEFLRDNVGIQAQATPEYPFAVLTPDDDSFYLRAPMSSDPDGSVVFAGDVPQGSQVRVTDAGRDQILHGAQQAANAAFEGFPGEAPDAMLIFSCAARKQILGTRCSEEIDQLLQNRPRLQAAGFYTYGEIAPLRRGGDTRFHNETVVAALIGT